MPQYLYKCFVCETEHEILKSMKDMDRIEECKTCSCVMKRQVTIPAKTATLWNGNWNEGLSSNMYSKALGRKVASKRQEEQIMRQKGFIPESDLGADFIDNQRAKMQESADKQANINKTYIDNLNKYEGDKIKAVVETFPAKEMLKDE